MKIENKYIVSGLKKTIASNLKSFLLLIPFFTLVLTVVLSVLMPPYNHYRFVQNGNHQYAYLQNDTDLAESDSETLFLANTRTNLMSHHLPEFDRGTTHYYQYGSVVDILLCHTDADVSNTMYCDANVLQTIDDGGKPHAWISYELAKQLHVGLGDEIYYNALYWENMVSRDASIRVTGITRTKYDDITPTKTQDTSGTGVFFLDAETLRDLTEHTHLGDLPRMIFADQELAMEGGMELYTSKALQLDNLSAYLQTNLIQFIGFVLGGAVLIFVIIAMDVNFTLKRHQKNLTILNMLGTPISSVRRILLKTAMLNSTVSFVVAFLLVKFVFLQNLLDIYGDIGFMLICFLGYWVLSLLFTSIQTWKIKRI